MISCPFTFFGQLGEMGRVLKMWKFCNNHSNPILCAVSWIVLGFVQERHLCLCGILLIGKFELGMG